MAKLPRVVLVGRTNVGKSTLFNRFSENVKSITLDYEGVTRDFLADIVSWKGKEFELIDTGGVSLRKTSDPLLQQVRQQAIDCIETASIVLFVCDATVGVLPEDREIARLLHKSGKLVFVVASKSDVLLAQEHEHEFATLGFKGIYPISAQHGYGIAELLEAIVVALPLHTTMLASQAPPKCRIILLGKPNVGKSSLMNLLLHQERTLVSPEAGTTREAISERISFYKEDMQVTDTPGLRRKRSIKDPIEQLMAKSSLRALERTDIVLLLIDASQGAVADQELKLAFYAFKDLYKGLLILFNKDDLSDEVSQYQLQVSLEPYNYLLKKVLTLSISCKTGKNIGKVLPLVNTVCDRYKQTLPDEQLSQLLYDALQRKPLYHKTNKLELFKVYQVAHAPITLLLTVNQPDWFGPSQLAFFEGIVRKYFDVQGVPIKFVTRKKR